MAFCFLLIDNLVLFSLSIRIVSYSFVLSSSDDKDDKIFTNLRLIGSLSLSSKSSVFVSK